MNHPPPVPAVPSGHPDRLRWNAKYEAAPRPSFKAHPAAARALAVPPPDGPVLDLACGPSGCALLAAGSGREVTAVDVSETALDLLGEEAGRRGRRDLITLVHADLAVWTPPPRAFALVVCTGFWDRRVFGPAAEAVMDGGLLAWEAFTSDARRERPSLPAEWCLLPGEPATHLPGPFVVLDQRNVPDEPGAPRRRLLARRGGSG
ncbi:methyltransferase domain-containing protein [Actinomadura rugatobispora]|uniref:Methyltransferase domain-containing protein n=1 Tax=Actinomadura rugatobispora TaxID=1994 RepID=A0ABW1A2W5_9ACTN|nr:class I SAM-dependent methyltransferase [Actinomadura rugatobispora]